MKRFLACIPALAIALSLSAMPTDTASFDQILLEFAAETHQTHAVFLKKHRELTIRLDAAEQEIAKLAGRRGGKRYRLALENKIQLTEELALAGAKLDAAMLKIRYRKGIELIKLMYEKILGLDHHFTSLHTFQNVEALSNPNSYPDFQKAKEVLERKMNKRFAMRLPPMLESNPYISATFTLVSALLGDGSQKEKEEDFAKIACILDFTVRMNADLNVIRNETEFLKNANQNLKEECERLFLDYTKAVGYFVPLESCRKQDDWETLLAKLDEVAGSMEEALEEDDLPGGVLSHDLVNIEFAIQRASDFITKYSNFIGQGTQYYFKFDSIIDRYLHENACQEQLPRSFSELKTDIQFTIEKFNVAYNLPELQGSKLKELMFGVRE